MGSDDSAAASGAPWTRRLLWLEAEPWSRCVKSADTLVTLVIVDPLIRLVLPLFLRARLSPNQVTLIGMGISIADAWLFLQGHLALGGVLFFVWYVVDCVDGKIARVTGRCTKFGFWLDVFTDRLGTALVAFGLAVHHLHAADEPAGLLTMALLVLWLFGSQNQALLQQLAASFSTKSMDEVHPVTPSDTAAPRSLLGRLHDLQRYRLHPWVFHDIEWLMIGLVVGPITGWHRTCLVVACGAMALQRAALTAAFWWRRRKEIATVA